MSGIWGHDLRSADDLDENVWDSVRRVVLVENLPQLAWFDNGTHVDVVLALSVWAIAHVCRWERAAHDDHLRAVDDVACHAVMTEDLGVSICWV